MPTKLTLPLLLLSLLAAIAFTFQWTRDRNQVYRLAIATGSPEGEYYAFAKALATVVNRRQPQIQITVVPTKGALENQTLVEQNQAQLAIVQSDTPPQPTVRAVAFLFPEVFHLIVRRDANINSLGDLKGKRIALMPQGSGSYTLFWNIAPHFDLTKTNLTAIPMPPEQAYEALRQKRVDGLFRVIAIGNPKMSDLLTTSETQLMAIDQVDALRLSLPFLEAVEIPKGTYDGATPIPSNDLTVAGVRAVLVARESINPEVVQQITQTLFEFRNELVTLYPRAATVRLPEAGENLGVPLHPGARAYYDQEKPSFLMEYSDILGLLLSVGVLCCSGLWQFRQWLMNQQKNRADMYNLEILALMETLQKVDNLEQLQSIRAQLFEILRKVVLDLDQDRISPESFQSFTFPWETAITALRHREMLLLNFGSSPSSP
ncbi:MAG: TAXI family TRAP transporter solute-binding subunit, partial [Oculatellaceae cyanobacterium Prado106]|nr:TAXI family TRAP transporter solute-binding subunit [Oculatellaceae cyanobacterium Prado106]